MRTIDAVRRSAVAVPGASSIHEAAQLMEQAGVGALGVLDGDQLVGVVTDRDLVRRAMSRGLEASARIDAVMSSPVVTIDASADLHDSMQVFRTNAVRRLAVMEGQAFVGMLTVDDVLIDLVSDLADVIRPVTAEVIFGQHDSAVPATT